METVDSPESFRPVASPSRDVFDEDGYLRLHPDVAAAIEAGIVGSGWQHFTLHGQREGRTWVAKPDRMAGVVRTISPRDEMFAGDEEHYFDVGESALHYISEALAAAGREPSDIRRILDLPCGHGRVLRFLRARFAHAEITACDLNRDGVEFCAQTFDATPVISNPHVERISLTGEFDLIWCGSLLTHLPREQCAAFLELFQRRLGRGGVLVFTLHGRFYAEQLSSGKRTCDLSPDQIEKLVADYRREGFGYVDYADGEEYGFSLTNPEFVAANLLAGSPWRLLSYRERGWDKRQDVVSLQKA